MQSSQKSIIELGLGVTFDKVAGAKASAEYDAWVKSIEAKIGRIQSQTSKATTKPTAAGALFRETTLFQGTTGSARMVAQGNVSYGTKEVPRKYPKGTFIGGKNVGGQFTGFSDKVTDTSKTVIDPNSIKVLGMTTKATNDLSKANSGLFGSMGGLIGRSMMVIPIWMAMRNAYMAVFSAISEGIGFWAEFETAMAEVRIVGQGTAETYKKLGNDILTFSAMYGVAAKDGLEAAKIFAQQGLAIEEVASATRTSMIASQVLGKSVKDVAEDLTAATRAYNVPMEDSLRIVDKWMNVQKLYAVTASDLADGMKTVGATASVFGISIDKLNGQLVGIIETTRKSGSSAANALQMMYTRLFSTAGPAIQTIAKVPIYLDETGKASMEVSNQFRAAGDVMDDVAKKWNTLSEAEKIALAIQIGSRRQATPFIALMQNYQRALEAEVDSLVSSGSAMEAFGIKVDTVAVQVKKMQSAWLQTAQSMSQTSLWKNLIKFTTDLAQGIRGLYDANGLYAAQAQELSTKELEQIEIRKSQLMSLQELYNVKAKLIAQGGQEALVSKIDKGIAVIQKNTGVSSPEDIKRALLREQEKAIYEQVRSSNPLRDRRIAELNMQIENPVVGQDLFGNQYTDIKKLTAERDALIKSVRAEEEALMAVAQAKEVKASKDKDDIALREKAEKLAAKEEQRYDRLKNNLETNARLQKINGDTDVEALKKQIRAYETLDVLKNDPKSQKDRDKLKNELLVAKATAAQEIAKSEEQAQIDLILADAKNKYYLTSVDLLKLETQLVLESKNLYNSDEMRLKVLDLQKQSIIEQGQLLKEYTDVYSKSLTGSFKDIFNNKGNLGDLFNNFAEANRNANVDILSEGLSNMTMATGLGDLFGGNLLNMKNGMNDIASRVQNAFTVGGKKAYDYIYNGMVDGAEAAASGGGKGTKVFNASSYGGRASTAGWAGSAISSISGAIFPTQSGASLPGFGPGGVMSPYQTSSQRWGAGAVGPQLIPKKQTAGQGMGGQMGNFANSAMLGYSQYQNAKAGGIPQGQAIGSAVATGVGSAMFGMGLAAVAAGASMGPVGWIGLILLAVGMALGMFGKKKSEQTTVTSQTSESRVASRIDTTNKSLEVINRNLVALRTDIRTYILPSSAYFAEKRNSIEDQFSIMSRRGFKG